MKKVLCFAAAGLIAAGASAQSSQPQLYGSASYGLLETEVGSTDFDTPTLNLAFGGKFNPNFALEGRLGFGVGDDSENGFEVEIEDYLAIYAKPILPVSDVVSVYALLGLAESTIDTNFGDEDDDDFIGLLVELFKSRSVNVTSHEDSIPLLPLTALSLKF